MGGNNPNPTHSVAGTVYRGSSDERIAGAMIKAKAPDLATRFAETNEDGDFSFGALEQGTWDFTALHEKSRSASQIAVQITANKSNLHFRLQRLMDTEDATAGKWVFGGILAGLLLLALLYVILHIRYPPASEPLSPSLQILVLAAQEDAGKAQDVSASRSLTATVSELRSSLDHLLTDTVALGNEEQEILRTATALVSRVEGSIAQKDKAATITQLQTLRQLLEKPVSPGFFWTQEPWRFVEVLFWGLAGILARLIITIGSYLRWGRYYKEGAPLHWAQLATIPLLVLVVVFLLSLVTIRLTLIGATEINLDLRDPRLLAAVSFFIGVGPWSVWKFVGETSERILGQKSASDRGANE